MGARSLIAILVLAAAGAGGCSGPRPRVDDVRLEGPDAPGEPYQIDATVRNTARGRGEVSVVLRLRDPATGARYEEQKKIQLDGNEIVHVVAEIDAPPAAYVPEARAEYPPP